MFSMDDQSLTTFIFINKKNAPAVEGRRRFVMSHILKDHKVGLIYRAGAISAVSTAVESLGKLSIVLASASRCALNCW